MSAEAPLPPTLGVAIMAGGVGRRLAAVTAGGPKALAPFHEGTLLDHQLARVSPLDPVEIVVLAHHHAAAVGDALGDRGRLVVEDRPLGTAGGLALLPEGPARWLVLAAAFRRPCLAATTEVPLVVDEGVVTLHDDRITEWRERPVLHFPVTIGLYVFGAGDLRRHLSGEPVDMPDLVRRMMPEGVRAWRHGGAWFDAGTPERLSAASRWWRGR